MGGLPGVSKNIFLLTSPKPSGHTHSIDAAHSPLALLHYVTWGGTGLEPYCIIIIIPILLVGALRLQGSSFLKATQRQDSSQGFP